MVSTATNIGFITQIIGPVIDVEYPSGTLPKMFNALNVMNGNAIVVVEVQQLLGDNKVRAIAMSATDGLKRGLEVVDTKILSQYL